MLFPIYNAVQSLDTNQIEAAEDLGSPSWRTHWRVVIPHAKPGIASGCVMVFMLSAGSIIVPSAARLAGHPLVHRDHPAMVLRGAGLEPRARPMPSCCCVLCTVFIIADDAAVQGAADGHREVSASHDRQTALGPLPDPASMSACSCLLFLPLIIMGGAALQRHRFPSVYPWVGFTDRWFVDLWNDQRMWSRSATPSLVALAVVAISVPIGTAAAILINSLQSRARSFLYGVMVAPILTPGVVIGISTLLFWNQFDVPAGPAPLRARPGLASSSPT